MLKKIIVTLSVCFTLTFGTFATETSVVNATNSLQESNNIESVETAKTEESSIIKQENSKPLTKEDKEKNLKANDANGFSLTIMSMGIVLSALIILSILFFIFGSVSTKMQTKKKMAAKGIKNEETTMGNEELDSGEVIAAISLALAQHFDAHDQEDTILTIKRMKRAYSPWNSKIYNMREVPMLRKNFK